jgi:hypothetical protein
VETKTMAWREEGRISLTVHTSEPPTDAEWQRYLDGIHKKGVPADQRVVVCSYGGGPNLQQRKLLVTAVEGRQAPVALFTSSAVMRGIGVALSWFNPRLKVFALGEFETGFKFLGLTDEEGKRVRRRISELEAELGLAKKFGAVAQ